MTLASLKTGSAILAAGIVAGLVFGWMLWRPTPTNPEPPAQAIGQADKSLCLERKPDPKPVVPHLLPKGAKLEREIQVTVSPSAVAMDPTHGPNLPDKGSPLAALPCLPVTVDLSLVRMPDLTRRVIASSPDGEIVGGLDVPVDARAPPRDIKWTVSALVGYDLTQSRRVYGAMASRTAGPFVMQVGFVGNVAFVGAGGRF